MNARLERVLVAAGTWAPNPSHVAAFVLLVVALVLDSNALLLVVLALAVYGLAHELTRPELEHVYCPCQICTTPADRIDPQDPT